MKKIIKEIKEFTWKEWLLLGLVTVFMIGLVVLVDWHESSITKIDPTDWKAKISDYEGIQKIADFKDQVTVGDNFVWIRIGKIIGDGQLDTHAFIEREIQINYVDFDENIQIDQYRVHKYEISKNVKGGIVDIDIITICSKQQWEKEFVEYEQKLVPGYYADEELQKIIDNDYKKLREKGTRIDMRVYPITIKKEEKLKDIFIIIRHIASVRSLCGEI